jgi:hypothetical protein
MRALLCDFRSRCFQKYSCYSTAVVAPAVAHAMLLPPLTFPGKARRRHECPPTCIADSCFAPILVGTPPLAIDHKQSVFMFRKVDSGPEFARDHESSLRFGCGSLVLYGLSKLRFWKSVQIFECVWETLPHTTYHTSPRYAHCPKKCISKYLRPTKTKT